MKSTIFTSIRAMTLVAVFTIPLVMAAQEQQQSKQQPRYKFVDLGTFGGPLGYSVFLAQVLNSRGAVTGAADTSTPDPNAPNCFNPDCFVSHAFKWQNGVLTDLGALPGVNSSLPGQINARGLVAGVSQNGLIDPLTGLPESRAVVWQNRKIIDLGTLGGNQSNAIGLNDRGHVIGVALNAIPDSFPGPTQFRAFLWQDEVMADLGTLGGPDAFAQYINERGQIAGFSFTNSTPNPVTGIPTQDPFFWENGTMVDLGSLGGTVGSVNDLNNRGQVIGISNLAGDIFTHGFLWDRGVLTDLGTLGGNNETPNWINDAGEVVGMADLPGDQISHAVLWKGGVLTDLGTVDGDTCSNAFSINSEEQIVGSSGICGQHGSHGFLSQGGGPLIDLNTLVPPGSSLQLTVPLDINDRGEITGLGLPPGCTDPFSCGRDFVLIPCGESNESCGDSSAETTQTSPATVTQPTSTTHGSPNLNADLTGRLATMIDRFRTRRGQQYRVPARPPSQ